MPDDGESAIPRLVLEKIGFDLRPKLESTLTEPLPAKLQDLADEVDGYAEWRDVGPVPTPAPPVEGSAPEPLADDAFRFE